MSGPSLSRRRLLGGATLAAVSSISLASFPATQEAHAAPAEDRPRVPLRILLKAPLPAATMDKIRALSPQVTLVGPDRFEDELPAADVVFGKIAPEQIRKAERLRWLQVTSVGVDAVLCPELAERDIILTNTRGCSGPPIAEHAIAFMLALTRGIGMAAQNRQWDGWNARQVELRGLTLGIIGLGSIGREVARRAQALDMHVVAVDAEPMYEERYRMADELSLVDDGLEPMLKRADVLICCAPLTRRTRGMLGAEQFALMKDGSYFVNVTRGPIVKTDALVAALKSGKLAGAGLDVTHPEPLPPDHELWKMRNVLITPHKAGGSQLASAREMTLFAENVRRYVNKLPMLNVVDKEKGY